MRRFIIPFFVGVLFASLVFLFVVIPGVAREKLEFGRKMAAITTKVEFLNMIHREIGDDYRNSDATNSVILFEVKDARVVVVDRDGIKTLRVR